MHWNILDPDPELVSRLQKEFNTATIIAQVMANRNIISLEESRPFFNPTLDQLHDPFLMKDMDKAVERILTNIRSKIPILVFGDYDVDGTTGASLLTLALKSLGARALYYIPNRKKEGYGVSLPGIDAARAGGADLMITCDCGINAIEQVDYAHSLGVDVIITDHHTPDTTLPRAHAILNPKRPDCEYPFKGLCGGGVAFKLVSAVSKQLGTGFEQIHALMDLVTLGTSSDMVPILDENRVIVHHGLRALHDTARPGVKALLDLAGFTNRKNLTVGQLVFWVAPRINAAGRLGDANRSVELLTTNDPSRAKTLAEELDQENKRRQEIQKQVVEEALRMANAQVGLDREHAVVLGAQGWHPGVVGIVASRLKEEFNRPAIIISFDDQGTGKGSARSIRGLDLYEALTHTRDHLEGYGGHPMAAGLTLREENFQDFRKAFVEYANECLSKEDLIATITLDGIMSLKDINVRFMAFLDKLAPYGPGNMRPKFGARELEVVGPPRVIGNGDHLRFRVRQERTTFSAIGFNMSQHYEKLITGYPVDLAFVVENNEWQGQSYIQLNVRDIKKTTNT